eukprot:s1290_g2.t1
MEGRVPHSEQNLAGKELDLAADAAYFHGLGATSLPLGLSGGRDQAETWRSVPPCERSAWPCFRACSVATLMVPAVLMQS